MLRSDFSGSELVKSIPVALGSSSSNSGAGLGGTTAGRSQAVRRPASRRTAASLRTATTGRLPAVTRPAAGFLLNDTARVGVLLRRGEADRLAPTGCEDHTQIRPGVDVLL